MPTSLSARALNAEFTPSGSRSHPPQWLLSVTRIPPDTSKNAARAFTGWTVTDGDFRFAYGRHDYGLKTILGATAPFDGDAVVNHLVRQPACSRFICKNCGPTSPMKTRNRKL